MLIIVGAIQDHVKKNFMNVIRFMNPNSYYLTLICPAIVG